jgi:hypothetical protein
MIVVCQLRDFCGWKVEGRRVIRVGGHVSLAKLGIWRDLATLSTSVTVHNSGFGGPVHALLPQNVLMCFLTVLPFHRSYCL